MEYRELDERDRELIRAAFEVLSRCYRDGYHHVASAVRAVSGEVFAGVHLESPGVDVCAEWVALGMAASAGRRELECIVAVRRAGPGGSQPGVMSPCGVCRELLYYHAPELDVIVPTPDGPRKVGICELLPLPYTDDPAVGS